MWRSYQEEGIEPYNEARHERERAKEQYDNLMWKNRKE